jgi:hypothetical protein
VRVFYQDAGRAIEYAVDLEAPALQLKQLIAGHGIPVSRQCLFFGRCEIEDGRSLADYGVATGDTLTVAMRKRRRPPCPSMTADVLVADSSAKRAPS